jgi:membrane protein
VSFREGARRIVDQARAMTLREAARELQRAYDENDLLTFANAIAFRLLFATIPLLLFGLGVLGGLGLEETWSKELAPKLKDKVSPPAFQLLDDTVGKVLGQAQVFWITLGLVIAVYAMSGGMRAIMDVFDRIYGVDSKKRRSFRERIAVSVALGLSVGVLVLLAIAVVEILPGLLGNGLLAVVRWPLAVVLLSASIALLVRYAPSETPDSTGWITFGSLVVVVSWLGTSLVFAWYLTTVADYGSVYGALATIIVFLQYLYLAAIAFLTGAQLDALVRDRLETDG